MLWSELKRIMSDPKGYANNLLRDSIADGVNRINGKFATHEALVRAAKGLGYRKVTLQPFPDHPGEIQRMENSFVPGQDYVSITFAETRMRQASIVLTPQWNYTIIHNPHAVDVRNAAEGGYMFYRGVRTNPLTIHYFSPPLGSLTYTPANAVSEALGERVRRL